MSNELSLAQIVAQGSTHVPTVGDTEIYVCIYTCIGRDPKSRRRATLLTKNSEIKMPAYINIWDADLECNVGDVFELRFMYIDKWFLLDKKKVE